MYLIEVIFPLPLSKAYHYLSPVYISPGVRVIVPLGKQKSVGIVHTVKSVSTEDLSPQIEYKEIEDILDEFPIYPQNLFSFLKWVSNYYLCPLGLVFKIALPAGTFKVPTRKITLTAEGKSALKEGLLPPSFEEIAKKKVTLKTFLKSRGIQLKNIKEWERKGWIKIISEFPKINLPKEIFYRLKKTLPAPYETKVGIYFEDAIELPEEKLKETLKPKEIKKLIQEGYLERIELPKVKKISLPYEIPENYTLTPKQEEVFLKLKSALREGKFKPFLLYGVTGSGKSLLYLEAIKEALALGKRVLFLLPEIALTHYTERLLYHFFKEEIALLHSTLSPQQRFSEWIKILEGRAKIVVGTRSAIFAPLEKFGLIIVDEEHDPSYKEENLPCKYNARDLALVRGKEEGAIVVLGSGTPSIKSYFLAKKGKYELLTLTERPFVKMPETKLIALKGSTLITEPVQKEIEETLLAGKAVFIYLNRRGYAPLVQCMDCHNVLNCPNCGIPLTYHKDESAILCHYCGFSVKANLLCPNCRGGKWKFLRCGTERIEEEVKKLFPGLEIIRFDRDTTSSEKRLRELLEALYRPYPKIIVGTQMGVHGHNFPQVNLVVVLRAEEGLFLPHYKASERTFQLLLQAAGRAGRKEERGKVIIQTSSPENYVIKCALTQDFEAFFQEEVLKRKTYGFPPFKKLALFTFEGPKEEKILSVASNYKEELEKIKENLNLKVEILGPSPCPLRKLRGLHRWQILLKADTSAEIHKLLTPFRDYKFTGIKVELDIDPESLL